MAQGLPFNDLSSKGVLREKRIPLVMTLNKEESHVV
jgi:hypothetical protein